MRNLDTGLNQTTSVSRSATGAPPIFFATARYFAARVKKARSSEARTRFSDAENFYRELGKIIPTFPQGFKLPDPKRRAGSFKSMRLYAHADQPRAIRECARDPAARSGLDRLAEAYEAMADSASK